MNVALIQPPITGHLKRGTGVYTENLFNSLRSMQNFKVELVEFNTDLRKFNLIHYPYFDPFFLTLPLYKSSKTVVTVHDLIPLEYPQQFPMGFKGAIKWQIQKISLRQAAAIITDSNYSKKQIIKHTGNRPDQTRVIPLGLRNEFYRQPPDLDGEVKKKYQLPDKFILNVGDVNYNKNIPGLLTAFAEAVKQNPDWKLVLVGNGFLAESNQLGEILNLMSNLKIRDKIIRLGGISTRELVSLYRLAVFYIQPSFAEGFGLTILEAMACSCPVISSNQGSLPEVGGEAVLYFDPWDQKSLGQKIKRLADDDKLQKRLIDKGRQRIKKFTWRACAESTCQVYKTVYKYKN